MTAMFGRREHGWRPLDQMFVRNVWPSLWVPLLVFLQVSLLGVKSSAVFELKLASFSNAGGRTWTGTECLGHHRGPNEREPHRSYKFRFCLGEENGNGSSCVYGLWNTGGFKADGRVSFGDDMKGVTNPIVKTMTRWPTLRVRHTASHQSRLEGVVKLNVRVVCVGGQTSHEVDSPSDGDSHLVDLISKELTNSPTNRKPEMTPVTVSGSRPKRHGSRESTSLTFSWRVYCRPDYYTTSCDHYCLAPSPIDHYYCDETGRKVCEKGWTGDMCDIDADDCKNNECHHGGQCIDGTGTYTCVCQGDFTGVRCETYIDSCRTGPCQNGATCHRERGGNYWCECTPQYKGMHCDTNKCTDEPCENGATCVVLNGSPRCRCVPGYVGASCDVDTCAYIACANNGTCVRGRCHCLPGYTDELCAHRVDPCSESSCPESGRTDTVTSLAGKVDPTEETDHDYLHRKRDGPVVKRQTHQKTTFWILVLIVIAVVVVLIIVIAVAAWLLLRANRRLFQEKAHQTLVMNNSTSTTDTTESDYDTNPSVHQYSILARYTSLFANNPVALPPADSVSYANTVNSGGYENPDYVEDQQENVTGAYEETDDVTREYEETGDVRTTSDNVISESSTTEPGNTEHVYLELIAD
ncbi:hypothetical protein LSAT2_004092 [Lamellibrachia satsuma]|nr:hypothetical protein LSAT2_004092 [Lamellibrachia satsuma]